MNTSFNKKRSLESAESYIENRFKTKRMKKVNNKEQKFTEMVVSYLEQDAKILDIPSGSGRFVHHFLTSKHLLEFDYDYNMLIAAKKRSGKGANMGFAQANITNIPLKENSMDFVFCMRLMHHLDSMELFHDIIKELARVSKEWIAISFFRKESLKYLRRKVLARKDSGYTISIIDFWKMAKNNGLKIKKITLIRNNKQTLVLLRKKG